MTALDPRVRDAFNSSLGGASLGVFREPLRGKPPTTVAQFRKAAEAGFRKANYEHGVEITIVWTFGPQKCTWPTGLKGFNGFFTASAPGYRTRASVPASFSIETGLSVG